MLFYLLCLIILQNKPVRLFADGRAQNNPHLHPHTLASCIPFFSPLTPTLITAQASKLPLMWIYIFAICLCIIKTNPDAGSSLMSETTGVIDWFVFGN